MTAPLSRLAPARRRQLFVLATLVVVAALALGAWLVLRPDTPVAVDQGEPGPVVVIPGYGGSPESVESLRQAIAGAGREVAVLDTPGDGTGDLDEQAEALSDLVDSTREEYGAGSVDVVGYSAGGVVARLYVRDHGGAGAVRRVVTLGSPHHGAAGAQTAVEAVGFCGEACEQLAPDSDLLRGLNARDETPEGPLWTTVRSAADEVVTPTDSAVLEGATNVLVQDLCADATTSHGELPGDPVSIAVLRVALGVDAPAPPSSVGC